jgi:TnpA family transposase
MSSAEPAPGPEHFLSRRERRALLVLPADPTDEDLVRQWTLSAVDQQAALRCRGDAQRRRFALQLCTVATYGRFLRPQDDVPLRILNHLAAQLQLPPVVVPDPPPREDTELEHQQRIREHLGYRVFDDSIQEDLSPWIYDHALAGTLPQELFYLTEEHLHARCKVVLPAPATLERLVASVCARAREEIFERVDGALASTMKERLDELLGPAESRRSRFSRFKGEPPEAKPEVIVAFVDQWQRLEDLDVRTIDLGFLSAEMVGHLADLADCYDVNKLRRFRRPKRHALMACYLVERHRQILDQLVDLNTQYLTGMSRRAMNAVLKKRHREFPQKRVRQTIDTIRDGFRFALDRFQQEDVLLKVDFFQQVDEARARQALDSYDEYCRLEDRGFVDGLLSRHNYLKRYLPAFLSLPLEASPGSEALLEAMTLARDLPRDEPLPPEASDRVVPAKLRSRLTREDGTRDRRLWEVGLAMTVRDGLKSGDLYLASSKRHVSFSNMIYDDARWAKERPRAYAELSLPLEPRTALDRLRREFDGAARAAADGLSTNRFAEVGENGLRLHRGQEDRYEPTPEVKNLRRAIDGNLPEVRIEEMLWAVDSWCGFLKEFTPRGGYDSRVANLPVALLATIVAQGTNLGIAAMAKANKEVSADTLQHVLKWYMREDKLRAANAAIVDFINRQPLTTVWGEGGFSSSDGQRFPMRGSSLLGTFVPRYFGYYERAVTVYTHVSDQFSVFSSQAISCSEREAMYVLEGLLENDTILRHREHTTDTHGYTEQLFGLCFLLGFSFMPRLADLSNQQLYKMDREACYGALDAVFSGTADASLVEEQWDELARVAASIGRRTAKPHDIMQRLVNASDRLSRALTALGQIAKTTFILRYIHDERLRRRIQLQLNRGEARHHLARRLFFAHSGEFLRGDLQEVMNKASCLSLLSNAVIASNIVAMTKLVADFRARGEVVPDEHLAHVWPLAWKHVTPWGMYRFTP